MIANVSIKIYQKKFFGHFTVDPRVLDNWQDRQHCLCPSMNRTGTIAGSSELFDSLINGF
jgi:hypothetical protein